MLKRVLALVVGFSTFTTLAEAAAYACGCFTPPDPSVPIVQAGERILFALENGQVTAHIQIQYQGSAADFGWLLPLPSVPTLELGTDELFNQLYAQTQPLYKLNRVYEGNCSFNPGNARFNGPLAAAPGGAGGDSTTGGPSPLVIQGAIGPYDYAVLKADSQSAMLAWLTANRYFVPAGTDQTVAAYIHPNAYFLALKLKSGSSVGELQPVVVKYPSDLPMIPIVLTSTGAQKNMGIQVWMLGAGRAIPRNYYHTVLDDARLDWVNGSQNYNDVIIAATTEAPGRHTFVTEYAGTSSVMKQKLNAPGRFGVQAELAASADDVSFINYLQSHSFTFTSQLVAILGNYLPEPAGLAAKNISPVQFYQSYGYYVTSYRAQFPGDFAGWAPNFQPVMMAQDIQDRVVTPTLAAGALFDAHGYLTRLYTTLSPEDMTKDPVFSYNAGLPDVSNVHTGQLVYHCGWFGTTGPRDTPVTVTTAEGWRLEFPFGLGTNNTNTANTAVPASLRIEILAEEGPPNVVVDNAGVIGGDLGQSSGCSATPGGGTRGTLAGALLLLAAVGLMLARSARRLARRRG